MFLFCGHAFSITSAYILHVVTNSRLVGPFTSMNIFNSGRIITLLRKHPSSQFRPSLLMLCGLKIPPLKLCWICFIGMCVQRSFWRYIEKMRKWLLPSPIWLRHGCLMRTWQPHCVVHLRWPCELLSMEERRWLWGINPLHAVHAATT